MKGRFDDRKSFIAYNDFSGGINSDCGEDGYAKNQLTKGTNIDIGSKGKVCTRMGITPLNSTSYNAEVRKYHEWRKKNGTVESVAIFKHNTNPVTYSFQKINRSTGANTLISAIEGDDFDFEVFNDKLLFIIGSKYRYYDGTTFKDVRQVKPTGTLTVTQTSWVPIYDENGNLLNEKPTYLMNGAFKFKFSTVNSIGAESPGSDETAITGNFAEQFNITIPVGDSDTVSRKIYRTKAGGSVFYLIDQIDDNTTTSYADTAVDTDLSIAFNETNIHTNLVKCTTLKRHPYSKRFFACGNPDDVSALYFSEPDEPWNWKESNVYYPNSGSGGLLLDICMISKYVVAMYESGPYVWEGIDPDVDVTWGPVSVNQAPPGKNLTCLTSNTITLANGSGLYMLSPSLFSANNLVIQAELENVVNLAKEKFTTEFGKITDFANSKMIFDWVDKKILLYCDDGEGNYRIIVYWWENQAFTEYTGWKVNNWFQNHEGSLMFCSDNYIFETKKGTNDNGVAIPFEFITGNLGLEAEKMFKIVSKLFLYCQQSGDNATINVSIEAENGNSQTLEPINLYSGSLWTDDFTWDDTSQWGESSIKTKERRVRIKGSKFKVEITNNILDETIILNSIGFRFKATKPKGERS